MRWKSLIFLLCLFGLNASPIRAEWHPAEAGEGRSQQQGKRLDRMAEAIGLSAEQKAKLDTLFKSQNQKMQDLQNDYRDKRTALHKETQSKVDAILTAEQREKYAVWKQKKTVAKAKRMEEKKK